MTERLEELFLLYSTAGGSEAELAKELKAEIARLTVVVGEWSRRLGGLPQPRHPGHLVGDCDESISQSLRASEAGDHAASFAGLRRAHRAVAEIGRAWESNLAYEAAAAEYAALKELAASGRLDSLLTFQDLALLLEQTHDLIRRRKYRQAEMLARACRDRCETLAEPQAETPEDSRACLERLSILCDEVARFLPPGQPDWADRRALLEVERLLLEDRRVLAERLVDDLEVELIPHRTFLDIYQRLGDAGRPPAADTDLRALIAAESWSAATSYMLRGALGDLGDRLSDAPARAAAIRRQVAAYQKLPAAR